MTIPVITFLRDALSLMKGKCHNMLGKHTERFCNRAVRASKNNVQKRVLLIAAVSADEMLGAILGLNVKRQITLRQNRELKKDLNKQQIAAALRTYTSLLLTLLGNGKEIFLQQMEISEQEWLKLWCWTFDYQPLTIQFLYEILLPAYQQRGIDGLVIEAGKIICQELFLSNSEISLTEIEEFKNVLAADISAVLRVVASENQEKAVGK